ncbi:TIGR01777 family oxidoreductase [Gordonia sp. VNK21]|uniref:TIGR01777 family oxidoreductase n=1 Tax=Gordonia sp. VNK21 TaxID=3382483 RepID=UPI0038D3DF19
MRVAIAGSSGLIGSALAESLTGAGHEVFALVRRSAASDREIPWDPETVGVPPGALSGIDAVVGLGGVSIGDHRWSGQVKQQLRDSRIIPTTVLAEAVDAAGVPVFVSASATGFYGDTGERAVDESAPRGEGFLADLVADWEAAAAGAAGARVVTLRTAPVLARSGGMLSRLHTLYRAGLGAQLGDGRQFLSWISLPDAVAAIGLVLGDDAVAGPVNLSAPQPVRYREFHRALARLWHRPRYLRVPAAVARIAAGEMAGGMILASSRVVPGVLSAADFPFTHPSLTAALEYTRG